MRVIVGAQPAPNQTQTQTQATQPPGPTNVASSTAPALPTGAPSPAPVPLPHATTPSSHLANAAPAGAGNYYSYREAMSRGLPSGAPLKPPANPYEGTKTEKQEKPMPEPQLQTSKRQKPALDGYNSDDERRRGAAAPNSEATLLELLSRKGYVIRKMAEDGNCLFRAIADQVYGDAEMHDVVRKNALDFIEKERGHFSQWITEDIGEYIRRKRVLGVFGNNVEIQERDEKIEVKEKRRIQSLTHDEACSELFNRPCEVYSAVSGDKPLNIFQSEYAGDSAPIRLSYHHGNHYNSVLDPQNPTVGVGLGLPNLQPGLADRQQLAKAKEESEAIALEQELTKAVAESTAKELESEVDKAMRESEAAAIEQSLVEDLLKQTKAERERQAQAADPTMSDLQALAAEEDMEEAIMQASMQEYLDSLKRNAQQAPNK